MSRLRAALWCYAYDAASWLQSVTPPVGPLTTWAFDLHSWVGVRMADAVFALEDDGEHDR